MAKTKSIADLRRELASKEKTLAKLNAQRQKLAKRLAAIDDEIAAVGGKTVTAKRRKKAARKRRRAKGGPSLADVLARVLKGKGQVRVAEATKLALAAGYKSKSSQFGNIVSQTLSADDRFKKIARGVYALKAGKKAAGKKTKKAPKRKAARKIAAKKKAPKKAAKKTARAAKPKKARAAKKATGKAAAKKTPGGLKGLLARIMADKKQMTVREAMDAALAAGYQTNAKDFRFIVNQTLMRGDEFKKVGWGTYALKG